MVSFNPACYVPNAVSRVLPSVIACPPPPSPIYTLYDTLTSPFTSTFTVLGSAMDALMSIPFFSFLLIPTMTSYSTSLNLLFFYLTWSTLVLSHPPLRVEIVASLAVKILFYILPSLLFLTFDILIPSLSESFKTLGTTALPLRNLSRANTLRQSRLLAWSLFNVLLSILLQAVTEYTLTDLLGHKSALKITTTLPLPWAILKDLVKGLLARDLLTYLIHRHLLHSPHTRQGLFSDLTRLHGTWYHASVPAPFPLTATYDHPLTHVLKSFLPTYIPAYYFRFHLLTYIVYLVVVSLEETFTHSGYATLPTNFVLGGIARRNELHCLSHGRGNYGTWGLVDWIVGSNIGGDVAEELVAELEEARVKEKVEGQIKKGTRGVKGVRRKVDEVRRGGSGLDREENGGRRRGGASAVSESGSGAAEGSRGKRRSSRRKKSDDSDYDE